MKKIYIIVIFVLFGFLGISCGATTTEVTQESTTTLDPTTTLNPTTTEPATTIDPSVFLDQGIEFNMLEYDDPTFIARIANVRFNIILGTITIEFDIRNIKSTGSYYMYYEYQDSSTRILDSDLKLGSVTIDLIDSDNFIKVELGFEDTSDHTYSPDGSSIACGFEYKVSDRSSRKELDDFDYDSSFLNLEEIEGNDRSASITGIIHDPNRLISEVKFVLIDPNCPDLVASEYVINDIETYRDSNGRIDFSSITLTGLTPNLCYQLFLYVSGNDGVYDFVDLLLKSKTVSFYNFSSYLWDGYDYFHGLYAIIYDATIFNGDFRLNLAVYNEGFYLINEQLPELQINFYRDITDFEPYYSIDIDAMEKGWITLDNELLSTFDYIKIEDKDRTIVLYTTELSRYLREPVLPN